MWLCGRNPASKSVRKSSLGKSYKKLIVHNYSALLYTYLRLVNSEGMLEHSVFEVRKLNARLNKTLIITTDVVTTCRRNKTLKFIEQSKH